MFENLSRVSLSVLEIQSETLYTGTNSFYLNWNDDINGIFKSYYIENTSNTETKLAIYPENRIIYR